MKGGESIHVLDTFPIVTDKTNNTRIDSHYFYQDFWAAQKIIQNRATDHVDVGSNVVLVAFLSAVKGVSYVDIRPPGIELRNFGILRGDVTSLPYRNDSVKSLSCLHVAEHIGLGRYGDSLDPKGTKKAALELSRVLAEGGNLYFSLPVGKHRVCFNAHRVHPPSEILDYFSPLDLVEFSGIDDEGHFLEKANMSEFENLGYGCGLFWFTKAIGANNKVPVQQDV